MRFLQIFSLLCIVTESCHGAATSRAKIKPDHLVSKKLSGSAGHKNWVTSVTFSPCGAFLVSGSMDDTVHLWDAHSGKHLQKFEGHDGAVVAVACSSHAIASGSYDRTVRVWERGEKKPVFIFDGHKDVVHCVAFSSNGKRLASGSEDGTVCVLNMRTYALLHVLKKRPTAGVTAIDFSPDGRCLASGTRDAAVCLWDLNKGECITTYAGHTRGIRSIKFNRDGTQLACVSKGRKVCLWNVQTGKQILKYSNLNEKIAAVTFDAEGALLVLGSKKFKIRIRDVDKKLVYNSSGGHKDWITAIAKSPNGSSQFASASYDKSVQNWSPAV